METWFTGGQPRSIAAQDQEQLRLAQISDCHLFADECLLDGIDSTQYLRQTLSYLATEHPDVVIFTGDLTQDHTDASFAKFATLYRQYLPNIPLFWVAGNHDEFAQIGQYLNGWPFFADKHLCFAQWQILLINSKGPTPSGFISEQHFGQLAQRLNDLANSPEHGLASEQQVLCFCHHHPLPVNGYIDKHGLDNGQQLVEFLSGYGQVKALAYGHVHQFGCQQVKRQQPLDDLHLYATGATSIQFTVNSQVKSSEDLGPACRLFYLPQQGVLRTEEIYVHRL